MSAQAETVAPPPAPAQTDAIVAPMRMSVGALLAYLVLGVAVLIIAVPLVWMVLGSFKTRAEILTVPIRWLPASVGPANYLTAWHDAPFDRFYLNSLLVTTLGGGLKVVNGVLTAYALVFLRFPKKSLVFYAVLGALMVSAQITLIPNYVFVANLGWIDTYAGLIVPSAATAIGTFMFRQHFLTIPREVIEAARMDGVGHVGLLWRVILPMSRPTLVTFSLLAAVWEWNDFLWPLLVTNSLTMRTLPIGLTYLRSTEGATNWGAVMAGTVLVVLPVLVFFLWAQRHIVSGIMSGSVKG